MKEYPRMGRCVYSIIPITVIICGFFSFEYLNSLNSSLPAPLMFILIAWYCLRILALGLPYERLLGTFRFLFVFVLLVVINLVIAIVPTIVLRGNFYNYLYQWNSIEIFGLIGAYVALIQDYDLKVGGMLANFMLLFAVLSSPASEGIVFMSVNVMVLFIGYAIGTVHMRRYKRFLKEQGYFDRPEVAEDA